MVQFVFNWLPIKTLVKEIVQLEQANVFEIKEKKLERNIETSNGCFQLYKTMIK